MFKTVVYSNVYLVDNIFEGILDIEAEIGDDAFNEEIDKLHQEQYEKGYEFVDMADTCCINKYGFVCVKAFITYKKIK